MQDEMERKRGKWVNRHNKGIAEKYKEFRYEEWRKMKKTNNGWGSYAIEAKEKLRNCKILERRKKKEKWKKFFQIWKVYNFILEKLPTDVMKGTRIFNHVINSEQEF
jgi:hypothetical protein